MYTINSYRNYLIISPFLRLLLHFKQLWWSNVRWESVLLSDQILFLINVNEGLTIIEKSKTNKNNIVLTYKAKEGKLHFS